MSRTRDFHKPDTACRKEFFERLGISPRSEQVYHGFGEHGSVYVHCHNHVVDSVAGEEFRDYPFDDKDKEQITKIFKRTLQKYRIEALSFCCMSNHYHALLVADRRKFTDDEMVKAYNKLYKNKIEKKQMSPMNQSSPKCKRMADYSNDISHFMRDFQHAVTRYYNKKNDRKGTLWRSQFKSVLVERARALVNMITYIELNPVRAGIVEDSADYPFSFWGEWKQKGRHPYQQAFSKHLRELLAEDGENLRTKEELYMAFEREMRRVHDKKDGQNQERNSTYTESLSVGEYFFCTLTNRELKRYESSP